MLCVLEGRLQPKPEFCSKSPKDAPCVPGAGFRFGHSQGAGAHPSDVRAGHSGVHGDRSLPCRVAGSKGTSQPSLKAA